MKSIASAVTRFANDEGGVTAIEYGLIAALIGLVAMTTMEGVGTALQNKFTAIAAAITNA